MNIRLSIATVVLAAASSLACAPTAEPSPEAERIERIERVAQASTGATCWCQCIAGYRHYLCDPTPSKPGSGDEYSAGGCQPFYPCQ
jgi:hypothetical protein